MLTMGIDIGSRSAQCVILEDGQLLTYSNIEITDYSPLDMQEARND